MERTFDTTGPMRLDLRIPAGSIEIVAGEAGRQLRCRPPRRRRRARAAILDLRGDELRVEVPERRGFFGSRRPGVG